MRGIATMTPLGFDAMDAKLLLEKINTRLGNSTLMWNCQIRFSGERVGIDKLRKANSVKTPTQAGSRYPFSFPRKKVGNLIVLIRLCIAIYLMTIFLPNQRT
jgi:hypothetical protein